MKTAWMGAAMLALMAAGAADAHEVWVERDGAGPARIYLGEPAEPMPVGGDPEFANLKAPRIVAPAAAALVRKAGFLEAQLPAGDVHVWDDDVFAPWGDPGKREGIIYYARAGRADPRTKLPFEIAPATANGTRFVLTREGKPVAGAKVTLISPTRVSTELVTDGAGAITPPLVEKGRYLLSAAAKDMTEHSLPRGPVTTLHRITTTSFTLP
ncbi:MULTISPECIES: DUF4198 domain-containing protein [unclassified Sphingomonas]|uniref:DUF4198 domain-containing protein n=1 Tax=unclassified Sphingomonas TaxID=196159 RepID=UPI001F15906B|nr:MULTISPECIES: DUF4198 domain-containing protein [unclassified Sphingomonas]MDY1008427.1 DUF4198 domain-containing protein [Sphingomonas sp. CFBP9019]